VFNRAAGFYQKDAGGRVRTIEAEEQEKEEKEEEKEEEEAGGR